MANKTHYVSYERHTSHWNKYLLDEKKAQHAQSWFDDETVDAWRHQRMYECLDPLLGTYPSATWLTVGDGRFGQDAHYIQQRGFDVLATDISDALLAKGQEIGIIKKYKAENAEALSFSDQTFDFVLCKESYHHFPRPLLALYEMLRVARKGVILIEPNDTPTLYPFKSLIKRLGRKLFGLAATGSLVNGNNTSLIDYGSNRFEPIGNYVYCISEREIEKVALGLNLHTIAFKGLNDHYIEGVEYEKAQPMSKLFIRTQQEIQKRDRRCHYGISQYNLLIAQIFLEPPLSTTIAKLTESGFKVIKLPINPYMTPNT